MWIGTVCILLMSCQEKQQIKKEPLIAEVKTETSKKDTVVFASMKREELMRFLPVIKGFTKKGDPSGESAHVGSSGNKYYSYAKQEYKKGKADYYIEIVDYKDDSATFNGLVKMYNSIKHTDTTEAQARLTIPVNNRFIITALVNGSRDKDELKKLVQAIKTEELPGS